MSALSLQKWTCRSGFTGKLSKKPNSASPESSRINQLEPIEPELLRWPAKFLLAFLVSVGTARGKLSPASAADPAVDIFVVPRYKRALGTVADQHWPAHDVSCHA